MSKELKRLFKKCKKNRIKWLCQETSLMKMLFKEMHVMTYPSNAEEKSYLKFLIDKWDEQIDRIERDFISHLRVFVPEDDDYACTNDEPFCKCKTCSDNRANNGTCSHCVTCIDGERAMDVCEEYKGGV